MTSGYAEAEEILNSLSERSSDDWQSVGRALVRLERISRASRSGAPWHSVVSDRLEAVGRQMSDGHLHKVHRVYQFLESRVDVLGIPRERMQQAKLSSVEVAERLFRLDTDAGDAALALCLRERQPAGLSEVKAVYEEHLARHPEQMNRRQAGWIARRNADRSEGEEREKSEPRVPEVATSSGQKTDIETHFSKVEADVAALLSALKAELTARDERIRVLEDEIEQLKIAHQDLLDVYDSMQLDTKEFRRDRERW